MSSLLDWYGLPLVKKQKNDLFININFPKQNKFLLTQPHQPIIISIIATVTLCVEEGM